MAIKIVKAVKVVESDSLKVFCNIVMRVTARFQEKNLGVRINKSLARLLSGGKSKYIAVVEGYTKEVVGL